jgi:hypothetical protein
VWWEDMRVWPDLTEIYLGPPYRLMLIADIDV